MAPSPYHGLLVIDKPRGITSRAAVDRALGWFGPCARVGHTGTLDPLATGVLVICVGAATRLAEFVQHMSKTYVAGIRLGACSDTDDADGVVTPVDVESAPAISDISAGLIGFVGTIEQRPPDFSAAKVAGRRAYDLARRGKAVTLDSRSVTIYGIDIIDYQYPRLEIEVRCGKGTYIRSLARDLGEKIGCGALIDSLQRTRVGPFRVEDALSLDLDADVARRSLLPLAAAVAGLPHIVVNNKAAGDIAQGRTIAYNGDRAAVKADGKVAAVSEDGRLVAIGQWDAARLRFTPGKVIIEK